jgi:UDP-glucose 4-epimerase
VRLNLKNEKVVVTGGAGFIGSHLVDKLVNMENEVIVVDNLSSGKMDFLSQSEDKIKLVKKDLMDPEALLGVLEGCNMVVHLAANPQVKIKDDETRQHIDQNILMTYYVLDAMRKANVPNIIFASTSTVYGEAETVPTPEDYGPLIPISLYGASKLACEALISAYCYSYCQCYRGQKHPRCYLRFYKQAPCQLQPDGDPWKGTRDKQILHPYL